MMCRFGMLSTRELKENIIKKYHRIKESAEKDEIYIDIETNVFFGNGTPNNQEGVFVFADKNGYHFVYTERGEEKRHQITYDLFEILYWALEEIIFTMATKFELKNRIQNQDFRKILFKKEIELFALIGENYKKRCEISIDEILKVAPYNDNL